MLPQIPYDKKLHLICGFMLSLLGLIYWPLYATGFVAGIVKEIWDKISGRGCPDIYDTVWTWVGAAAGVVVCLAGTRLL